MTSVSVSDSHSAMPCLACQSPTSQPIIISQLSAFHSSAVCVIPTVRVTPTVCVIQTVPIVLNQRSGWMCLISSQNKTHCSTSVIWGGGGGGGGVTKIIASIIFALLEQKNKTENQNDKATTNLQLLSEGPGFRLSHIPRQQTVTKSNESGRKTNDSPPISLQELQA